MDNKTRHTYLERIAQKHIPDDADLWAEIAAQLPQRQPQRRLAHLPLAKIAAAFVALLLVGSAGVYAVLQNQFQSDPGLEGVQAAALVTPLDWQQTIDGRTVTLDWAFADSRRIAVHMTVEGVDDGGWWPQVEAITDSRGLVYPLSSGQPVASAGDLSWVQSFSLYAPPPGSPPGTIADDTGHVAEQYGGTLPESLTLNLTLELERQDRASTRVGPYTFSFEVPLLEGRLLDVGESQTAAGYTMTLERLVVSTSQTAAYLCYTHPEGRWHIEPSLQTGGETVDIRGIRITGQDNDTESCAEVEFNAYYDDTVDTVTLTVPSLIAQGDLSYWQDLPAAATAAGIDVTVHDNRYELIAYPDDMTAATAAERVLDILADLRGDIAGPWVFTIELE